jgi:hypothetical protein
MRIGNVRAIAALIAGLFIVSLPAHAMSCLLFPLSCLKTHKKYGEEVDANIISIDVAHTRTVSLVVPSVYDQMGTVHQESNPLENTREYFVAFQVGMTRYVAWKKDTVIQMAGMLGGYTPKRQEWVGKTMKMRFVDENWMGIKSPTAVFKTPKGKDWKLVIVDIIGPDGVDECAPYFGFEMNLGHCKPQAEVDRAKREQEILDALKAKGIDTPIWDVQDRALAQAVYRERAGTSGRQGSPGAEVTHDKSEPAAVVPHPEVGGSSDATTTPTAAPAAPAEAPAPATTPAADTAPAAAPTPAATPETATPSAQTSPQ